MGVTAQDIQICLWQVLKFTTKTVYYCARRHPIVSSILLFLFLLYMFLPSVFTFLIYFSPLVVFTYAVHRVFLVIDGHKVKISKENEKRKNDGDAAWSTKSDAAIDYKKGSSSSSAYATAARQRNASQKSNEDYKPTGVEDKDTVCSTSFNNDLVDKSALAEDNPKEIREVKVDSVVDRVECPRPPETRDRSSEGFQKFTNGKSETSERESPDDTEDDEEEEQEEDRNKAVRWTEDDQKNLMDLGLSEIERNKRLESLIARRRSRKYMTVQGRRTMGYSNFTPQISSLQIPRNNPFLVDNSGNQTSPVPGSAPSILLPTNNPFDLPYDPFEEKPNLTGGSFHQEFMVPNQKEMMFCRHESFSMGAFLPPEAKTDNKREMHHDFFTKQRVFESPPSRQEPEGEQIHHEVPPPEAAVLKDDSASNEGKEDSATSEQALSSVGNHQEDGESEVQTKEIVVDVLSSGSNSSSSSEANEPIFRPNREAILNSLRLSSRRNMFADREGNCQTSNELYDSALSDFNKRKAENFFNVNMAMRHTPSHSIASDLQVEVSEVGSPPLTNISSQDEVSSTNDGDIEKEINSGSDEMWAASTHLSGVDENESRSREVHEVSELDVIGVGFSNVERKSDPDASHALPEKVIAQDTNYSHSFQASSYETSSAPVSEKAQISTEELASTRSHEGDSVQLEESYGPMKLEHELKTIDTVNDPEVHVKNETGDFISAANMSTKSQTSIQEENAGNLSTHQKETILKSSESGGQVQKQLECEYSMDSSKPHEIKDHLTSLEDLGKVVPNLAHEEDMFIGKKSHDREGEQCLAEVEHGASEVPYKVSNDQASSSNLDKGIHKESETLNPDMVWNNHLNEHDNTEAGAGQCIGDQLRSAVVVPDLEVEQVRLTSGLSSPKSVLQPTFSIDQASSPSLGEEMYGEVRRTEIANGETNSLHQQQHDNLTTAPEDAIHLNDIPRDVPSHEKDSEKLENSGSPSMASSEEVNHVSVVNGSATEENHSKDKLDSTSDDLKILSSLEASIEILRPAKDTDPKETEAISKKLSGNQSPAPDSIPADQIGVAMLSLTRQEEQSNPPPEWSMEELTFNSSAYDSGSEMGDKGPKSIAGGSECASESITGQSSVHHSFSRSSEDFIQDLFSSLVGRSASASASVTRQSSVHEFSRSSEDFLQDLFKSLVSEAGGSVSNRASRQGSMLETSESAEDMIQDLFKSLQDNPRE